MADGMVDRAGYAAAVVELDRHHRAHIRRTAASIERECMDALHQVLDGGDLNASPSK
jgi:hypothetical protein